MKVRKGIGYYHERQNYRKPNVSRTGKKLKKGENNGSGM